MSYKQFCCSWKWSHAILHTPGTHLVFFATNVHLDITHKYHQQTSRYAWLRLTTIAWLRRLTTIAWLRSLDLTWLRSTWLDYAWLRSLDYAWLRRLTTLDYDQDTLDQWYAWLKKWTFLSGEYKKNKEKSGTAQSPIPYYFLLCTHCIITSDMS